MSAALPTSPLANASVLITGGTGAFGQAFVRHALAAGARRVAILSRGEAAQAAMRQALEAEGFDWHRCRWLIGDVRDATRMLDACRGVDIVVHAAALKRVETCEENTDEARKTNIDGTANVARACIERGVQRAALLSTDKAAAPATAYGATKAAAERSWIGANAMSGGRTLFAATRYGNVTHSTGSVLPLWAQQRANGLALTITDPAMTRFLMPMADAVALVERSLTEMRGGETFVPMLGAARISRLAAALYGTPDVRVIGLRVGEKLHEVLVTADEACRTYRRDGCYVIEPAVRSWASGYLPVGDLVEPGFELRSDDPALAMGDAEIRAVCGMTEGPMRMAA